MPSAVSVILTLLLLAGLIAGIIKKLNPVMLLFFLSVVGLLIYGLITGTGLAATSSGNALLDTFSYFDETWKSGFTGNALIVICIVGYVGYMNHLKASNMFAILVARQLLRFKNAKWVAGVAAIILIYWMSMGVPSGVAFVALLFGTLYPVLRYLGMNGLTAASLIVCSTGIFATPNNAFGMTQMEMFGLDPATMPQVWMKYLMPLVVVMHIAIAASFIIWSKIQDSRDEKKKSSYIHNDPMPVPNPKDLGVPYFYAILPLLPLIFIICGSSLVQKAVTLSIVAATVLAFVVAFVIRYLSVLRKMSFVEVVDESHTFFKEVGGAVGYIGMLIVCGMFFSGTLTAFGGFSIITNFLLTNLKMPLAAFLMIFTIISALMYCVSGSNSLSIFAITPLVAQTVLEVRPEWTMLAFCLMSMTFANFGAAISPISSANLLVAGSEKVPVTVLIKRTAVPTFVGMVASSLAAFLLYA